MTGRITFEPDGATFDVGEGLRIYRAGSDLVAERDDLSEFSVVVETADGVHDAGVRDGGVSRKDPPGRPGRGDVEVRPTRDGLRLIDHGKRADTTVEVGVDDPFLAPDETPVPIDGDCRVNLTEITGARIYLPESGETDTTELWRIGLATEIRRLRDHVERDAAFSEVEAALRSLTNRYLEGREFVQSAQPSLYDACLADYREAMDVVEDVRSETAGLDADDVDDLQRETVYEAVEPFLERVDDLRHRV